MRSLSIPALVGCIMMASGPAGAAKANATGARYEVQRGDTPWGIARAVDCSVAELQKRNDLAPGAVLRVGDELVLPSCAKTTTRTASARPGLDATQAKPAPPGPPMRTHTVAAGETLSRIAGHYATTVADLERLNGLTGSTIFPGQELVVGSASAPAVRVVVGQSVGRPHQGKLRDAVQLPHDPGYYRRRVDRSYAAQHVVDQVRNSIAAVRKEHRGLHRLAIGDLSKKRGGPASGHASHQSGRDVDLGLYFKTQPADYPQEFVRASDGKLHLAATWALVYTFYEASKKAGGPERIFLDYRVQRELYDYAAEHGISKKVLGQVFQYPNGRWTKDRLVQHEPHHADHLHVRFACPKGDRACK